MKLISEESLKELLIVGALLFAGRLERNKDALRDDCNGISYWEFASQSINDITKGFETTEDFPY